MEQGVKAGTFFKAPDSLLEGKPYPTIPKKRVVWVFLVPPCPWAAVPTSARTEAVPTVKEWGRKQNLHQQKDLTSLDLKHLGTPTWNHGTVWVGEDLKDHLVPTPAPLGQRCILVPPIFFFPSHKF